MGLIAEHGLAIYIETEDKKTLFDTGQSGLFLKNAIQLDISIEDIDVLVLSHGHHDHTGGLYPFLEKNSKAKVYAKKDIFTPKYAGRNRFIGTLFKKEIIEERLVFVEEIVEIAENIFIMPDIPIYNKDDTHFKGLNKNEGENFIVDEFEDELFIAIREKEQINIVTACSHRGITNICTTAKEYFKLPVGLILGGFHLKDCDPEIFGQISQYFKVLNPKSIGVCHCTGIEKFGEMLRDWDLHLFYNNAGNEITI